MRKLFIQYLVFLKYRRNLNVCWLLPNIFYQKSRRGWNISLLFTLCFSGILGYYFTNLSCALQFVQNMNAESLKMPKEEFEAYTSGRQVPPLNTMNSGCNQVACSKREQYFLFRCYFCIVIDCLQPQFFMTLWPAVRNVRISWKALLFPIA